MKTAFLFSGQGSQQVGMMQDICEVYPQALDVFSDASRILEYDIASIINDGPQEELDKTENTQPCLLTAEIAGLRALEAQGIHADLGAGFSLGEWTALVAAEVISFEQAIRFVQLRARAMQDAVPIGNGGMAVIIGKQPDFVDALCRRVRAYITPSNYNCPGQITVAGTANGIEELMTIAEVEGIAVKKLSVSIPSHCKLMQPAADRLAAAIEAVPFRVPKFPVIMNATGLAVTDVAEIKRNVISQLILPVQFEKTLQTMIQEGADTFIEIGPGKTLTGFVKKVAKQSDISVRTLQVANMQSLQEAINAIIND